MDVVRSAIERVRGSLFFAPSLIVAVFIVGARLTVYLDARAALSASRPFVLSISAAGGRTIASAVAAATITVAAIVFSITALSSQIAATQYSPRAVAGFFDDRLQQVVIGVVVGTFAYSLIVLAALADEPGSGGDPASSISVTVTVVLGIISALAILAYLDHSLRRMRIGAVVRRIAEEAAEAVRRESRRPTRAAELEEHPRPERPSIQIRSARTGWVAAIDGRSLSRNLSQGSMAGVEVRVGEAVLAGDLLATVWPGAEARDDADTVRHAVHIRRDRSVSTDPTYGIRQLVDIGLRALSPGVNDPTTAVDVIQHLKIPLREILTVDQPGRVFAGPDGQRVLLTEAPSRSDYVHAAFSEMRLAAATQPAVLKALLESIADLIGELKAAELEARTTALMEEARLTAEAARRAGFPESDLNRVLVAGKRLELADGGE